MKDAKLSNQERAAGLVSRMTLDEKVSQMVHDAPAIERLGIPEYNWWNECLHGVARAGVATVFPQAIGLAATWNADLDAPQSRTPSPTRRGQSTTRSLRRDIAPDLQRADLLVAEHQHLPRSALGPGPGDLRRGPVPHGRHGRRLRQGPAGRRSALPEAGRHAQALCRPQRPRVGPPLVRRPRRASAICARPTCPPSRRASARARLPR